tara:strand:+ start:2257 stop:2418 length:162 start_codon:yes stop_codon:yes gene_type:complete
MAVKTITCSWIPAKKDPAYRGNESRYTVPIYLVFAISEYWTVTIASLAAKLAA